MDLSALNSSLPQGLADAERDMGEKFRGECLSSRGRCLDATNHAPVLGSIVCARLLICVAAALSITTLYKSSLACNKVCVDDHSSYTQLTRQQAYQVGYSAAL